MPSGAAKLVPECRRHVRFQSGAAHGNTLWGPPKATTSGLRRPGLARLIALYAAFFHSAPERSRRANRQGIDAICGHLNPIDEGLIALPLLPTATVIKVSPSLKMLSMTAVHVDTILDGQIRPQAQVHKLILTDSRTVSTCPSVRYNS